MYWAYYSGIRSVPLLGRLCGGSHTGRYRVINPDLSECGPHGDQWSITYTWALVPDADARHLASKCYEQRKPSTRVLRRATVQTGFLQIPTWLVVLEFFDGCHSRSKYHEKRVDTICSWRCEFRSPSFFSSLVFDASFAVHWV